MANRFWVGGTGTWDNATTTHWAASSGGAGGQSVPVAADSVFFDGSSGGGTVTVNHASLSVNYLDMSAFTGTLDFATNNNNITIGNQFNLSGSSTRTLNMGNGTWTFTNVGGFAESPWQAFSTSNLTLNCNSSTILYQATATGQRNIALGSGQTYNNITINNASVNRQPIVFNDQGNNTIANLTFTNVRQVYFVRGCTYTITGAFTWNGGTSAADTAVFSAASAGGGTGNVVTFSVAAATTFNWMFISGLTKSGAGSITANSSIDGSNNTS